MVNTKLIEGRDGAPLFIQSVKSYDNDRRVKVLFFNGLTIDMPARSYRTFYSVKASQEMRNQAAKYWRIGSVTMERRHTATVALEVIIEEYRAATESLQITERRITRHLSPYRYC